MSGVLVCIEGIDGAGKRTQSELLSVGLLKMGVKSRVYSYPDYNSAYGKMLKKFLDRKIGLSAGEKFFLFLIDMEKDRAVIEAKLKNGGVIITDRYFPSTVAYQSADGLDFEKAKRIEDAAALPRPSVVFYLSIDAGEAMKRKMKQRGALDRHEARAAYLNKVKAIYDRLYNEHFGCERWIRIDAAQDAGIVHKKIFKEVNKLLAR